ncbi:MAG: hypothetical protein PHU93_01145 [Candidatus Gracilibacteria bacterium]|nr:hypothetical protein [Candidatus Gracilibacteria bacterium]
MHVSYEAEHLSDLDFLDIFQDGYAPYSIDTKDKQLKLSEEH